MFLSAKEYDIEDFLKSLKFIPPKGTSVQYFISPKSMGDVPEQAGFEPQVKDVPPDESVTYVMTPPIQKVDQAVSPAEYSSWTPGELSRRQPTPNILPKVTEPEDLDCPFVQVLSESKVFGTDVKLLEDFGPFYKNTVFHCVPGKLNERGLLDTFVNIGQNIPLPDGDLKDSRDRSVRRYWLKHYPDEAGAFYEKEDLRRRDEYEAANPSAKKKRLQKEAIEAEKEKYGGYKGLKSPEVWKRYFDEVAPNNEEFMSHFEGPVDMKRKVLARMNCGSTITNTCQKQLATNRMLSRHSEKPVRRPKLANAISKKDSELFESIYHLGNTMNLKEGSVGKVFKHRGAGMYEPTEEGIVKFVYDRGHLGENGIDQSIKSFALAHDMTKREAITLYNDGMKAMRARNKARAEANI